MNISIIIPLYNKGMLVTETLDSILEQTYQLFEIIIVDDGSTDDSVSHIYPYLTDKRIKLITQVNAGPGAARNFGVKKAQYDWISFIDADDVWHQDFLLHAVESLNKNVNHHFFFSKTTTDEKLLGEKKQDELSLFNFDDFIESDFSSPTFKTHCDTSSGAMLARKDKFISAGGFYEKNKCIYGEDSFLITIILVDNLVVFSARALLLVRSQPDGLSSQAKKDVKVRPLVNNSIFLYSLLKRKELTEVRQYISYLTMLDAKSLSSKGRGWEAIKLIKVNFNSYYFTNVKMIKYIFIISTNIVFSPLLIILNKMTEGKT